MMSSPMELSWSYIALAALTTSDIFPVGMGENTRKIEFAQMKKRNDENLDLEIYTLIEHTSPCPGPGIPQQE